MVAITITEHIRCFIRIYGYILRGVFRFICWPSCKDRVQFTRLRRVFEYKRGHKTQVDLCMEIPKNCYRSGDMWGTKCDIKWYGGILSALCGSRGIFVRHCVFLAQYNVLRYQWHLRCLVGWRCRAVKKKTFCRAWRTCLKTHLWKKDHKKNYTTMDVSVEGIKILLEIYKKSYKKTIITNTSFDGAMIVIRRVGAVI